MKQKTIYFATYLVGSLFNSNFLPANNMGILVPGSRGERIANHWKHYKNKLSSRCKHKPTSKQTKIYMWNFLNWLIFIDHSLQSKNLHTCNIRSYTKYTRCFSELLSHLFSPTEQTDRGARSSTSNLTLLHFIEHLQVSFMPPSRVRLPVHVFCLSSCQLCSVVTAC